MLFIITGCGEVEKQPYLTVDLLRKSIQKEKYDEAFSFLSKKEQSSIEYAIEDEDATVKDVLIYQLGGWGEIKHLPDNDNRANSKEATCTYKITKGNKKVVFSLRKEGQEWKVNSWKKL